MLIRTYALIKLNMVTQFKLELCPLNVFDHEILSARYLETYFSLGLYLVDTQLFELMYSRLLD